MSKITPCLWFDRTAEEAAKFYVSLLPDSHVDRIHRAPSDYPSGKAGDVLTVEFTLMGQPFMGLNGGPFFKRRAARRGRPSRRPSPRSLPILNVARRSPPETLKGKEKDNELYRRIRGRRAAGEQTGLSRYAREALSLLKDHGATRMVENWGDDVPEGKVTDFHARCKRRMARRSSSAGSNGRRRTCATPA
jgi:hypothetical protein